MPNTTTIASRLRGRATARAVFVSCLILAAAVIAAPLDAQSFLGTIRGTVVDPQGQPVKGAAILIVDEATEVPRALETDDQGRYEAANLRPGSYRVEVVTPNFKRFEQPGLVLRAAGTQLVDVTLEIGNVSETVTVSADALNNITLDNQAITRGLDEQQLHDLPSSSRDVQAFLLLNPNVVGGSGTDIQFLGAKTYGVSYIQDGQASTNAIFGTVGNSAPGLDAVSEITVLSNSYSAEYGGLAGVVVTTKRGGQQYRGTGFFDYNSDELNALTYNQTLAGVERGDPLSDTHQRRWGAGLGGPLVGGKLFFYANYEGSDDKAIYGGGRATVPTGAMRNGDFRGTAIRPIDPTTGQPFPDQVIPGDRIDPAARAIIERYYPLPNQGTLANGYGVFQQFLPQTRNRQRGDLRLDYEAGKNDTIFLRTSYQHRNPNSITFEAGNALTNMPILDSTLDTASVIGGWTKILGSTMVNEFRTGYNYDNSKRQSNFKAAEVAAELGIENAPSKAAAFGFPSIQFVAGQNRPTNIVDAGRNVDRTLRQNAFSISNNLSWITGGHSLKVGGLFARNMARDGFGIGVNNRGLYRFNAGFSGNSFTNLLLGLPVDVRDQVTARGPLQGYSHDFAVFAQDDWKVNRALTVFLGVRYEVVGTWHEDSGLLANFIVADGGHHVVPSQEVAAKLPPGLIALGRTRLASEVGLPDTLLNADKDNFSPRVGFAWRLDESNKTVVRGGFGLFHPTVAVQGIRDLLATNEFRYTTSWSGGRLRNGFSGGTPFTDPAAFGNQGIDPNLEAPDIYQYNLTVERELPGDMGLRVSYIGSTMRKLLVDRDFNTLPASTVPFVNDGNPEDMARLPFAPYGSYMDIVQNTGSGQYHSAQFEVVRRYRNGLALNAAYTLAHSDSNAPDTGNSTIGPVQFDPYDIEKDRGPDPNVVKHRLIANATWDIPVGRGRRHGANMSAWTNALFGGWTVSGIFQARSGQNLTPFFSGIYYTTNPWNTGKPLDGLGNFFCCAWRPDQISDPNVGGSRESFFNQAAYAIPGPGKLGNAKKGSLKGPGTWIANFAFYKDVFVQDRFRLQFSTLLDNAFNHPQFFPTYGSGFVDLTSYLTEGDASNGTTAVLGADTIGNSEGFSPGRVIRIGLRAFF
jgi:hypothetical protein